MRKTNIIFILFLCFLSGCLQSHAEITTDKTAEGFSPSLRRLYNGCVMLSDGIANGDCEMVGFAVDSLNQNISFEPKPIVLGELRVTPVDTANVIPISNCFDFTDIYGLMWRDEHCNTPFVSPPGQMRGKADCYVLKLRLKPNSSAEYTTNMQRHCQVFAIGEPDTEIDFQLIAPPYITATPKRVEKNLWLADWDGGSKREKYTIVFTNNSTIPSTIYFITN